jgi:S1-C subfamily serine protease
VLIHGVEPGSPARLVDLREGDIVIAFKNQTIGGIDDLVRKLVGAEIGIPSTIQILRGSELIELQITPQELIEQNN